MGKQKTKDVMPVNWRIDAVCAAAQKARKGYAKFVAEDLSADPDLYQRILDEFREAFLLKREREAERVRRAAKERAKAKGKKRGSSTETLL